MNDIQERIGSLRDKGWTLAAIADEMSVPANTVDRWWLGERYPANATCVNAVLGQLMRRRQIPKRRRVAKRELVPAS